MDEMKWLRKLAEAARLEQTPRVDVAARVRHSIAARKAPAWEPIWALSAALSLTAAVAVAAVAVWYAASNPMLELLDPVMMVLK